VQLQPLHLFATEYLAFSSDLIIDLSMRPSHRVPALFLSGLGLLHLPEVKIFQPGSTFRAFLRSPAIVCTL